MPIERAVLRATDELVRDTIIGEATWHELTSSYTTAQVLDLIYAVGNYVGLAMVVNTFGVAVEHGDTGF